MGLEKNENLVKRKRRRSCFCCVLEGKGMKGENNEKSRGGKEKGKEAERQELDSLVEKNGIFLLHQ